jgi:hypothetical protein
VATDARGTRGYAHRRPSRDDWFSADGHAPAGGRGSDRHSHPNWTSWRDADACHPHADDGCRHADAIPNADPFSYANADWYAHAHDHPHPDSYADADWNSHTHRHAYIHAYFYAYCLCNADRHTSSHYGHANTDGQPHADRYPHAD